MTHGWMAPWKDFIGDLARPFAIYAVAATTALAIVTPSTDTGKLTAAGLILAALYGARGLENREQGKRNAEVEIAKTEATAGTPT